MEAAFGLLREYGLRAGLFLANFGAAKAAAYFGPLLLARLLEPSVYGHIEFAWSVAVFAVAVLGGGILAALPQLSLLRRRTPVADIVAAAVVAPGAVAIL